MEAVFDGDAALAKPGLVEEEALSRGIGEEQAPGLGVDEEVEAQLRGALGTEPTAGTGAVGVIKGAMPSRERQRGRRCSRYWDRVFSTSRPKKSRVQWVVIDLLS